ncbi:MAG: hypothetical protein IJV48_08135 [Ruminococcus sp.]|nr:hypothetical protein [Ruminococcus sp.]
MKFPNAAKGMKKIYTSEILKLIATIFLIAAVIMIVIAVAGGQVGDNIGSALAGGGLIGAGVCVLVWMVLVIIGFILKLVGIINASHDEESFKSALIFWIIGIAAMIVSSVLIANNTSMAGNLLNTFSELVQIFITIFVIAGGVKLADRLNRGDVSAKGTNVLKLIIVIKILSLIAQLVSTFMGGIVTSVVAGVIFLVALLLEVIQYFMYLSFLSQAKKMLIKS